MNCYYKVMEYKKYYSIINNTLKNTIAEKRKNKFTKLYKHLNNQELTYLITSGCIGAISGGFISNYYTPNTFYVTLGASLGCIGTLVGTAITLQELKKDIRSEINKLERSFMTY